MNIAILSRNPALYSTQSLARAARLKHHYVRIIDYNYCDLIIEQSNISVAHHGQIIKNIDAIIPRIGASYTNYGAAVIRQFEEKGVFSSLSSVALLKSRDKLSCAQHLAAQGIAVPKTIISNNHVMYEVLLRNFKEDQIIIKPTNGTHGTGVILANKRKQAEAILEALNKNRQLPMMQEYIEESKGSDIRIFIVDGKVVGSMKRQAKEGEFRSNLHRGGIASIETISEEEKEITLRAVKYLGLHIAGVDILRSNRGPLVLEVNASPGLEGIETTTQIDIAGEIIKFIEREVDKQK